MSASDLGIRRLDDVLAWTSPGGEVLAVACDSLGAIGPKPLDEVRVPAYVVGRFACRVPLMELLAIGARPLVVVNALAVEPSPTGEEITRGVREEMVAAGLDPDLCLTGSSEKNVPTSQTGLGIVALGAFGQAGPRWGLAREGDVVVAVGEPKVGGEVTLDDRSIADIPTLSQVLDYPGVGDVVPVGSGGIASEARRLAGRAGLTFEADCHGDLNLEKSAGPATCVLASLPPQAVQGFLQHLLPTGRPCQPVGVLRGAYSPGVRG